MEKNKPLVEDIKKIQACRNCQNNNLKHILSIGNQYLVDFLEEDGENFTAPLELVLCDPETNGCGLLQLHHTVSPDLLYRRFWYKSGVNQTIRDDLEEIVRKAEEKVNLENDDIVLDIGANDGTFLEYFKNLHELLVSIEQEIDFKKIDFYVVRIGTVEEPELKFNSDVMQHD